MNPIHRLNSPSDYTCYCEYDDRGDTVLLQTTLRNQTRIAKCISEGGSLVGPGCNVPNFVPDVFFFSVILFLATYIISVILKDFKSASFFPARVRAVISDFAVVIAIFSMTFIDFMVGVDTPKLMVPQEFKVSQPQLALSSAK